MIVKASYTACFLSITISNSPIYKEFIKIYFVISLLSIIVNVGGNFMNENILIVEDDTEIARVVADYLQNNGYRVLWASTGVEGLYEFKNGDFDLIIVDVMMPEMDGFTLCKNIRLISEVPILITSAKNNEEDKVKGLRLGVDDYITKPFSLVELEARIESNLRRYRIINRTMENENTLNFKEGLSVNLTNKTVTINEEDIHLTSTEYELLLLMMKNPNKAFTKKELYENVWNEPDISSNNIVTVHVKQLREKIKDSIKKPRYVETVWGTGYRFIGEKV